MAVKGGRSSRTVVQLARPTLRETIARDWPREPRYATGSSASCAAAPAP